MSEDKTISAAIPEDEQDVALSSIANDASLESALETESETEPDGDAEEAHARHLARERKLKARESSNVERPIERQQPHRPAKALSDRKWVRGRVYVSLCEYTFGRVVVDEAHCIRNPGTLLAEAIYQTGKRNIHFLTATVLLNHAKDLRGYLHQIFKESWKLEHVGYGFIEMYDDDFDPQHVVGPKDITGNAEIFDTMPPRTAKNETLWQAYENGVKLYMLEPKNYASCGRLGDWSAELCARMMPPLLNMLQLRLGYETEIDLENGETERVGKSIPPCNFYTVQLEMSPLEKRLHDTMTLHMLSGLGVGDPNGRGGGDSRVASTSAQQSGLEDAIESEGIIHAGVHRYLKHGTMDPRLCILTEMNHKEMTHEEKVKAAKGRRNNWTSVDIDHGASMFFLRTRDGPHYGIPSDRINLAKYLCGFSVKMRYAFGILAKNIAEGEKTVMVFEYPMPLW